MEAILFCLIKRSCLVCNVNAKIKHLLEEPHAILVQNHPSRQTFYCLYLPHCDNGKTKMIKYKSISASFQKHNYKPASNNNNNNKYNSIRGFYPH